MNNSNIKIALLSDSHFKPELLSDALTMLKSKGAQYILHAGDFQTKENLDIIKDANLPYVGVYGNNDHALLQYQNGYNLHKEPYYFKIKEYKFKMMHLPFYMSPDSDIVIFGHTHKFESDFKNGTLFLNPGEICARNKNLSECVLLEITEDKYIIEYNFKKPEDKFLGNKNNRI